MESLAAFRHRNTAPSQAELSADENGAGNVWIILDGIFLQTPIQQAHDILTEGHTCTNTRRRCIILFVFASNFALLCLSERAECDREIDRTRDEMKRLLLELQRFRPSDLSADIVQFALKENTRLSQGKEMEADDDDDDDI